MSFAETTMTLKKGTSWRKNIREARRLFPKQIEKKLRPHIIIYPCGKAKIDDTDTKFRKMWQHLHRAVQCSFRRKHTQKNLIDDGFLQVIGCSSAGLAHFFISSYYESAPFSK